MKKERHLVGFGMVFAGLVFFFNPNVSLHDVLPDVLGALLIFAGLKKAADADNAFDSARKLSLALIWLYLVKFVFAFTLFAYPDMSLPLTFLSGVLEGLFLIAFFNKLYGGFEYAAMRAAGEGKTTLAARETRTLSLIFAAMRSILAFLPEILVFMQQTEELDLSANAAYRMPVIRLKPYVVLFCVVAQLILGVLYLARTRSFFRTVRGDSALAAYLNDRYTTALSTERPLYAARAVGVGCLWCIAAAVFAVDFAVGGYDVLPDIAGGACLALSFGVLSGFDRKKLPAAPTVLFLAAGAVMTAVSALLQPPVFELLSGEKTAAAEAGAQLLANGGAFPAALAASAFYFAATAYAWWIWLKRHKLLYAQELFGNHDRKLLCVFVLSVLTSLTKGAAFAVGVYRGQMAAKLSEVAAWVGERTRMTAEAQAAVLAEKPMLALFENLDGAAFILTFVTAALAVFTVFNLFALKAQICAKE